MQPPDIIFAELFTDVQTARIFPDSKTFVDCTPLHPSSEIMKEYREQNQNADFDLKAFVLAHFSLPTSHSTNFQADPSRSIEEHIQVLWEILQRDADQVVEGSSLIPLPHPYIVPGGRFGEIYYWDSYFTILGLLESGRVDIAKSMLANFAYLIDTIGHIPNGNRTYFLSRSQPPFFALMVREVAAHTGETELYMKYAPFVGREYDFWMDYSVEAAEESSGIADSPGRHPAAFRRAVELGTGVFLNRYWDDTDTPRQESYIEDVELAHQANRDASELYRDIRAACESGWDFSARWFEQPDSIDTIMTTSILPVDLNCLLWSMEFFLAKTYEHSPDEEKAGYFLSQSERRKDLILRTFWNAQERTFRDFNFRTRHHTSVDTLAMMFPLYMQIATDEQAKGVAASVRKFLRPGGLVTTVHHTGQQWDAPNGWAPLQWIAYRGLKNYGYEDLANDIALKWTDNVTRVYKNTGRLVEKYNVEDITLEAGGGEYPVQDGFGWTNGVMRKFLILDL
jgi:alpha,alpha-trehalase